jgi:hypothetical protein
MAVAPASRPRALRTCMPARSKISSPDRPVIAGHWATLGAAGGATVGGVGAAATREAAVPRAGAGAAAADVAAGTCGGA